MNRTIRTGTALAVLLLATSAAAGAQGLMSGTGLQPSTQLATPPGTPAIDRPGAEQKALAQRARTRANHPPAAAARPGATNRTTTPPRG